MEAITLNVEVRQTSGGESGKRLRAEGLVPAVVYGKGSDAKIVTLREAEVKKKVYGKSLSQLFRFESAEASFNGQLALVKEIQVEPIKSLTLHVDFLAISEDQKITVPVAVKLTGESPTVKGGEGLLNFSAHEILVSCIPSKIPSEVVADISALMLGDSIHASDIILPEGVTLKSDAKLSIVSVIAKREEAEAAPAAVAAAAPAAAAGAAPAAAKAPEKGKK